MENAILAPRTLYKKCAVDPDDASTTLILVAPCDLEVLVAGLVDDTTLAKSATNYRSFKLQKLPMKADGTLDVAVDVTASCTMAGASGDWLVANIPTLATLSTTVAYLRLAAGDALQALWAKTLSPTAMVDPQFAVVYMAGRSR